MAINIIIEKKHVYVIFGLLTLFTAMVFVYAATSNPGHIAREISGSFDNGSYTFPGSITIGGLGGDVPHGCYKKTKYSASAVELFVSCAAGEVTVGGGGACTSYIIRASRPSPILSYWNVVCSGTGEMTAYAVCCKT